MKVNPNVFILIVLMGIVTYLPRLFPLLFLSRRQLPWWFKKWLDFIPVAVLSALVLSRLAIGGNPGRLDWLRPELMVAVPTFLFAYKTRSLGGTVLFGMTLFWLVGIFLR